MAHHFWTRKGWLSEVLVKAHFAKRRTDQDAGVPVPAAKIPATKTDVLPFAPAFASAVSRLASADTFEVTRGGKPLPVRLFDVACDRADRADEARALASRHLGDGPVWIFPSSQRRLQANEPTPVRVWTANGWLSDALVKAGLARRHADPDDPSGAASNDTDPTPPVKDPTPARAPKPAKDPDEVDFVWREVPVSQASTSDPLQCESNTFKITYPEWRISWSMTPVRTRALILLNIYRVDEKWETRNSSHHVQTLKGPSGGQALRSKPGDYWIRVTQSSKLNVKVEVKEILPKAK